LSNYQHVDALHQALHSRLDARMLTAGWVADPTANLGTGDGVVGLFRHRLNEDFAVTAWFAWVGDFPPLQVDTAVGVSYQRSYRVWPYLLSGYPHSELRVGVQDLGGDLNPVELWEFEEVDRAVDQLVTPVLDQAIDWAEPFASLEALLVALEILDVPDVKVMDIPVVLAAAGRSREARQALADALAWNREYSEELYVDDFVVRFKVWFDSGAPPMPPDEPGPSVPDRWH
jgi:hypothetical protein